MPDNDSLSPIERSLPQRVNSFLPATLELDTRGGDSQFNLASFGQIFLKRLPTIITATVVVSVLTGIYTFRMQPIYRATASIEVEADYPQLQSFNEVYRQTPMEDPSFLSTQMQVLDSDSLAWTTLQQLGLDRAPASLDIPNMAGKSPAQIAGARKAAIIETFKAGINVEPVKDTRIVDVSYDSGNPDMAATIVNHLVNNYIDADIQERGDFTRRASAGMELQLQEMKDRMERSQALLLDYERQNLIVSVGDKGTINDQRLMQLNSDYISAETDRVQKESAYELAKGNQGQAGVILQDSMLQHLEERLTDLKANYALNVAQYGPNFPRVVQLHEQLAQMQGLMDDAHKMAIEKLHNEYLAGLSREKMLDDALDKEKAEVALVNQRMIEHNALKRDFETNQTLYESLMQRLKDATLASTLQTPNVHVIDLAVAPSFPVLPKKQRNLAAGLIVGLILGISLAFVQEALDSSVRTTEEAERLVNAPALAVIPAESNGNRRKQLSGGRPVTPAGPDSVGLAVLKRPSSPLAESFRILRTSVLLSTAPRPPQTLLVTSAQVGEGKTSSATNLAMSFAQRGGQVLIIDADLRRPSIAKTMGIPPDKGLSSFLTGAHSLDEVLIQYERVPNLWVLPAGPRPPDPAELLSSQMMETTLKDLMKRFTQIVIDSPPLLLVTDAVVLSAMVDGVILVVASGTTARGALTRAHRILENAGSRVLGIVLNKVDMRFDTYYGSYYGSYHQSYYDELSVSNPSHTTGAARPRSKANGSPRRA